MKNTPMKKSPAEKTSDFLIEIATVWLLLVLVPLGIIGLLLVRVIEAVADSRAWAAFARFWWGTPHHGR